MMSSKLTDIISTELQYINWGHFIISKFQWIINIVILIGVYKLSLYYIPVFFVLAILAVRMIGWVVIKTGIRDKFIKQQNKSVIESINGRV